MILLANSARQQSSQQLSDTLPCLAEYSKKQKKSKKRHHHCKHALFVTIRGFMWLPCWRGIDHIRCAWNNELRRFVLLLP
jgi:hypothetical protein